MELCDEGAKPSKIKNVLLARPESSLTHRPFYEYPNVRRCLLCNGNHSMQDCSISVQKCKELAGQHVNTLPWVELMAYTPTARNLTSCGTEYLKFLKKAGIRINPAANSLIE